MNFRNEFRLPAALLAGCASILFVLGCDGSDDDSGESASVVGPVRPAETGHDHDHGHHDHDHHDHDHDHGHHDDHDHVADDEHGHGESVSLGQVMIGSWTVDAARSGEVAAASEIVVDLDITGGTAVDVVRMWVGTEDARGSIKVRADGDGDAWHGHVAIPAELPPGSAIWIEIASGDDRVAGSVPFDDA